MTTTIERQRIYDPLTSIELRPATPEESAAAKGGYIWKVIRTPWDLTRKVMGTATLLRAGSNALLWERPTLQAWVDKACQWGGLRPEESFMYTFHSLPIGNLHFIAGSQKGLKALFSHHRNEELFANNLSMTKLFTFCQQIFPEEKLTLDDFILTCAPGQTRVYRTLLHTLMQKSNLKGFAPKINNVAQAMVSEWAKQCDSGEIINATEDSCLYTSSIISKLMFEVEGSTVEIAKAIDFINLYIRKTMLKTATEADHTQFKSSLETFRSAINAILAKEHVPLFGSDCNLTTGQKKVLIFTLFFAGQETTASLLVWMLRQLALSSELQSEFRQKLTEINQKPADEILNEQMALFRDFFAREIGNFPPAFSTGRKLAKDVCIEYQLDGETFKRKFIAFQGEILSGRVIKQAELELASGRDDLDYHDWVPFGSGPHRCPGEELAKTEIVIFLSELLSKYKITLVGPEKVEKVGLFTLKLSEDILVRIEEV